MADVNDPQINKHVNEAVRPLADRWFGMIGFARQHKAHYDETIKPRMNELGVTGPDELLDGAGDGRTPAHRSDLQKGWNVWDQIEAVLQAGDNYDDLVKLWVNSNPPA